MFRSIRRLFKVEKARLNDGLPLLHGLRLNGSFRLDALPLRGDSDALLMSLPPSDQLIEAQGVVSLDRQSSLHRYYATDDYFIQIETDGGHQEQYVSFMWLFQYYQTLYPSPNEWDRFIAERGLIGQPELELEGLCFRRVWSEHSLNWVPAVHMRETTHKPDGSSYVTDQFAMLYQRSATKEREEFLLVAAEETEGVNGELERCVVYSLGVAINPHQLSRLS